VGKQGLLRQSTGITSKVKSSEMPAERAGEELYGGGNGRRLQDDGGKNKRVMDSKGGTLQNGRLVVPALGQI
jgi:hypothetical protein